MKEELIDYLNSYVISKKLLGEDYEFIMKDKLKSYDILHNKGSEFKVCILKDTSNELLLQIRVFLVTVFLYEKELVLKSIRKWIEDNSIDASINRYHFAVSVDIKSCNIKQCISFLEQIYDPYTVR